MFRTLTQQATLAALVVGAVLVIIAIVGFVSVRRSTEASTHLGDHVLAEMEASHLFAISIARGLGEAESFARGREEKDRTDAQARLAEARNALATLDSVAAAEAAD